MEVLHLVEAILKAEDEADAGVASWQVVGGSIKNVVGHVLVSFPVCWVFLPYLSISINDETGKVNDFVL